MYNRDIFSLLFKWAQSTRKSDTKTETENYCTQILAIVLSHLLDEAIADRRSEAVRIINSLFAKRLGFSFAMSEKIAVKAQERKGRGRPDLILTTEDNDKLTMIEIKVDSPVNRQARVRLRGYKETLSKEKMPDKGLVLITRSGNEDTKNIIPPKQQISWSMVSEELHNALETLRKGGHTESAAIYLLENFYEFLKERGMAILKVEDRFDPMTVHNVTRLLEMLSGVCRELKIRTRQEPRLEVSGAVKQDESYLGYSNRKDGNYAIRIYPEKRVNLYFEIHEENEIRRLFPNRKDGELIPEIHKEAELWKSDGAIYVKLDLGDILSGEGVSGWDQSEGIKKFISGVKRNWERLKKSGSPKRS